MRKLSRLPERLSVPLWIGAALAAVAQPALCGSQPLALPTRIVFTEQDCRDINEKRTLRGRPVCPRIVTSWDPGLAIWDGLQVFTGKKADVIKWFRSGQHGRGGTGWGGVQNLRYMRSFQYDVLCSKLLQTGDLDVIRAVLRHAFPTGDYVLTDWRRLVNDKRLTTTERIAAWAKSFSFRRSGWERPVEEFWRLFGASLTSQDIIDLHQATVMRWHMFDHPEKFTGGMTKDKARALVVPLVRREYLSVQDKARRNLVGKALQALVHLDGPDKRRVAGMALDKLASWDALGDERSTVVWRGILPGVSSLSDEAAGKLEALIPAAKVPLNAAEAFYAYHKSPAGTREIKRTGLAAYLRSYLDMAFSKSGSLREYPFLRALVATDALAKQLTRMLRDRKVDLTVTSKEFALLKRAWRKVPRALEYLIVEDMK